MKRTEDLESVQVGDLVSIFKRGRVWYANYQHDGRQQRPSLKTKVKNVALKKATELEIQLQQGNMPRKVTKVSLEEVQQEYLAKLESLGRAPSTISHNKTALNGLLKFAATKNVHWISQIDLPLIDDYCDDLRRLALAKRATNSNKHNNFQKTISFKLTVARSVVLYALRKKYIQDDPLVGLRIEKPKTPRQPFWTWQEVQNILNASPPERIALFTTLAYTGMRIGEAIHLEWSDVDFRNCFIHIQAKPDWKPKSGEDRVVPMVEQVRSYLNGLSKSQKWVFARPVKVKSGQPCSAASMHRAALRDLQAVLKELKLSGRLHTFRHALVTHALISGTPAPVVRDWVGHLDPEMIRDYTHIVDSTSKSKMNDLFGSGSGT
ncbi:MAG: Mobile element protein [Planctomycetaceae bacterium]|nr:Mobile element protein [Planctomycetaceae bacterium]